eukprot:NODE_2185_length_1268_cov_25.160788_g1988_i0.p1 GENE.NODE_2185_length_1268_cov_25.160788_g1988_i0~~NODE_2185_length_1268_cov_25.160788_g1988_i0.p1  ORF type:complete len:322 (-),score=20.88 NODE_2185_length_1268_cov_25.160788_g1988_i0:97-1062(-)
MPSGQSYRHRSPEPSHYYRRTRRTSPGAHAVWHRRRSRSPARRRSRNRRRENVDRTGTALECRRVSDVEERSSRRRPACRLSESPPSRHRRPSRSSQVRDGSKRQCEISETPPKRRLTDNDRIEAARSTHQARERHNSTPSSLLQEGLLQGVDEDGDGYQDGIADFLGCHSHSLRLPPSSPCGAHQQHRKGGEVIRDGVVAVCDYRWVRTDDHEVPNNTDNRSASLGDQDEQREQQESDADDDFSDFVHIASGGNGDPDLDPQDSAGDNRLSDSSGEFSPISVPLEELRRRAAAAVASRMGSRVQSEPKGSSDVGDGVTND